MDDSGDRKWFTIGDLGARASRRSNHRANPFPRDEDPGVGLAITVIHLADGTHIQCRLMVQFVEIQGDTAPIVACDFATRGARRRERA